MKTILFSLPVAALALAAVVLIGQSVNGRVTTVSALPASVQSASAVAPTSVDNPMVIMQNWQQTAARPRASKFIP